MIKSSHKWTRMLFNILNSKLGIWLCSQPRIDLNSQSNFYDVLTRPYKYLSNTISTLSTTTTCTQYNLHVSFATEAVRLENLHIPLAADGREICLRFLSKVYCIRFCTRSHAPMREHNQDTVIRYIRVSRKAMDTSRKRNFDGGGDQGSHREHWDRSRVHGHRNSERQHHGNGAIFGGVQGGHYIGIDGNHSGSGGTRRVNGNNANPPHQDG